MNCERAGKGLLISYGHIRPRIQLVRFGGELTADAASRLATWTGKICGAPVRVVHADVSRLEFIDDPGAWTLALAFQCIRLHGNPVEIYHAPFPLRCVLEAVCVDPARRHGNPAGLVQEAGRDRDSGDRLGNDRDGSARASDGPAGSRRDGSAWASDGPVGSDRAGNDRAGQGRGHRGEADSGRDGGGRDGHERLAVTPSQLVWRDLDLRICGEDPRLASMFAIFDRLGSSHVPPAEAVLRPGARSL